MKDSQLTVETTGWTIVVVLVAVPRTQVRVVVLAGGITVYVGIFVCAGTVVVRTTVIVLEMTSVVVTELVGVVMTVAEMVGVTTSVAIKSSMLARLLARRPVKARHTRRCDNQAEVSLLRQRIRAVVSIV